MILLPFYLLAKSPSYNKIINYPEVTKHIPVTLKQLMHVCQWKNVSQILNFKLDRSRSTKGKQCIDHQ